MERAYFCIGQDLRRDDFVGAKGLSWVDERGEDFGGLLALGWRDLSATQSMVHTSSSCIETGVDSPLMLEGSGLLIPNTIFAVSLCFSEKVKRTERGYLGLRTEEQPEQGRKDDAGYRGCVWSCGAHAARCHW